MGANGTGTLVFQGPSGKTFTLDLSNTTSGDFSFKGNLQLIGGGANLTATFNKDMIGNIGAQINGNSNAGTLKANFNNGAKLTGNIQTGIKDTVGGNDFTKKEVIFDGAGNATDIVMQGNIIAYGTGYGGNLNKEKGNHVTFTKGSMQGNIEARIDGAARQGYNKITLGQQDSKITGNILAAGGTNEAIFSNGGVIEGVIHDDQGANTSSKNIINFNGNGNASIKSSDNNTTTAVIKISIGTNTITFNNTGEQNIIGTIQSNSSSYSYTAGSNTISFSSGSSAKISGNVYSSNGKNTITFSSNAKNAKNEIDGMVDAHGGNNDIFFGTRPTDSNNAITASGNATSKITHGIYARDGSATIVFATNGDATIGKINTATGSISGSENDALRIMDGGASSNISVSFYGNANNIIDGNIRTSINAAKGIKTTNINFFAGTNKISGNIIVSGYGDAHATNTINFMETSISNEILGNIQANGSGTNKITFNNSATTNSIVGNISASSGTNTITFGEDTSSGGTPKGKASSVANTITGNISANSGTNEITLYTADSTLAINGSITNNAGTNTIKAENGSITIKKAEDSENNISIKAEGGWNATNTIIAKTLDIDVDMILAGNHYNGDQGRKNIITATESGIIKANSIVANNDGININQITLGNNSQIIAKEISAQGKGTNNITLGNNTSSKVSITGDISASGGTNNIKLSQAAPTFFNIPLDSSNTGSNVSD
ncbi:hypothetical protein CQA57_08070, partial [Helicobacter anseris]